jgi:hypothetical protein
LVYLENNFIMYICKRGIHIDRANERKENCHLHRIVPLRSCYIDQALAHASHNCACREYVPTSYLGGTLHGTSSNSTRMWLEQR